MSNDIYKVKYWSGTVVMGIRNYFWYEDAKEALMAALVTEGGIINSVHFICINDGKVLYKQELFCVDGSWYNWTPTTNGASFMKADQKGVK